MAKEIKFESEARAAMAAGVTACRDVVRLKAEIERLKEMINNK